MLTREMVERRTNFFGDYYTTEYSDCRGAIKLNVQNTLTKEIKDMTLTISSANPQDEIVGALFDVEDAEERLGRDNIFLFGGYNLPKPKGYYRDNCIHNMMSPVNPIWSNNELICVTKSEYDL